MKKLKLIYTKNFHTQVKTLIRDNIYAKEKLELILNILLENPFSENLLTRNIEGEMHGHINITNITKDTYLLWEMENEYNIFLLAIRRASRQPSLH